MTIFKDALEKAGFSQKHFEARTIITNLMKGGLSATELIEIVHEVEETLSEGQILLSKHGQNANADAQPPMPEGHCAFVREDHTANADGQPIASGEAIDTMPEKASRTLPPARDPVSPMPGEGQPPCVREDQTIGAIARQSNSEPGGHPSFASVRQSESAPSARDRATVHNQAPSPERMQAVRQAGHSSVDTIFERFKLPDARRIGDVRPSEYRGLAGSYVRYASLFLRLDDYAMKNGKMGPGLLTRDIIPAKMLEKLIQDSGVINLERTTKRGILIEPNGNLSLIERALP